MIAHIFTIDMCKKHPNSLFIFGDNQLRIGIAGQAVIREQKNAIGIATKKHPGSREESYFTDAEYEENCKFLLKEIEYVKEYAKEKGCKEYIFPKSGLGTGLAAMPIKAPLTFCFLTEQLIKEFQFNNLSKLENI
jgi:hypothetical protein